MKRKLRDLLDECRTKKRELSAGVTGSVESSKELLQSADVPVSIVPSSEIPVTTEGHTNE